MQLKKSKPIENPIDDCKNCYKTRSNLLTKLLIWQLSPSLMSEPVRTLEFLMGKLVYVASDHEYISKYLVFRCFKNLMCATNICWLMKIKITKRCMQFLGCHPKNLIC